MANATTDEDIIQDAYAERLKAVFDNYAEVAPSDPEGAKAKFVAGVTFLRNLRASALQALPPQAVPAVATRARTGARARKNKS